MLLQQKCNLLQRLSPSQRQKVIILHIFILDNIEYIVEEIFVKM